MIGLVLAALCSPDGYACYLILRDKLKILLYRLEK